MLSPIKIKNLSFRFKNKQLLFDDLSFSIPGGKFSLLTGPSGSGKSTFLKILAGFYQNYEGKIENVPEKWSMIFQDPDKQFTMATPKQEFIFTLENLQLKPEKAKKRIKDIVRQTEIGELMEQPFATMSGGEKQRVAFAVALAMEPDLLLLDEPFASCDSASRKFLLKQLAKLKNKNITIIISDHNFSGYQELIDEVNWCEGGKIKEISFDKLNRKPVEKISLVLPPPADPIFELKDFALIANKKTLIKKENFEIYPGTTLLTGANGSGKSSFFKALTKMMPYEGQVKYQTQDIKKIENKIYFQNVGQIFQDATDQFLFVTVGEELEFCLAHCNNPLLKKLGTKELLDLVDLRDNSDQVVYSLSGGQKKKLQLLVMLFANPNVLLLDEPFAGLDTVSQQEMLALIKKYFLRTAPDKGLILISHQLEELDKFFNYHLEIKDGQLNYEEELN